MVCVCVCVCVCVRVKQAHEKAADAEARSEGHSDQEQADEWQEDEVPSSAIVAYVRSPVVLPNVALAFLYCTVLSLGYVPHIPTLPMALTSLHVFAVQAWTGHSGVCVCVCVSVCVPTGF